MDFLKNIPVLGALSGQGVKSSEGVGFGALIAWAMASDIDIPKAVTIAGLAVGLGLYAFSRSCAKSDEALRASRKEEA